MIMNRTVAAILAVVLVLPTVARASVDEPDDEVERHLAKLRPRLENKSIDPGERAVLALEMASTLDRAAQGESKPERKRARWLEAAELLETFNFENPTYPRAARLHAPIHRLSFGARAILALSAGRRADRLVRSRSRRRRARQGRQNTQ